MTTNPQLTSSPKLPIEKYSSSFSNGQTGIFFYLPSRARFIPYAWLLHAEMNRNHTELVFNFTHCVVTVQGENLVEILKALQGYGLKHLQEMPLETQPGNCARISRIDIVEKA